MNPANPRFIIPERQTLINYKQNLKKRLTCQEEPKKSIKRVYYDSFDWALYKNGGVLEAEVSPGGGLRLRWLELSSGRILGSIPFSTMPRFIWDFPAGPFKDRLAPILDVRILLPQITLKSDIHPLKLLNKEGKTVLQLSCEENKLIAANHRKEQTLGKYLQLMPVRGYPKPVSRVLSEIADLRKMEVPLLEQAIAQLNIVPASFSSKLDIPVSEELTAEQAVKLIFTHLLQTLEKNENGLRQDLDSEFLHDFRVAIRRIRSGLGQLKHVFPQKPLSRFREDFAWLGQETSKLRDLDVYLLKFDAYQADLPRELQTDLEPLRRLLQSQKRQEHQKLIKSLNASRYRRLLKAMDQFLKQPFSKKNPTPQSQQPILSVASERIWRVYQQVLKQGIAIQDDTPEERLHELRKTCKKLRYLMEFFQKLYPQEKIGYLIKVLKRLQENLGDFQDYHVQGTSLMDFGEEIIQSKTGTPKTPMALGMLVKDLKIQQNQARQVFQGRFEAFASADHQKQFKRLFGTRKTRKQGR